MLLALLDGALLPNSDMHGSIGRENQRDNLHFDGQCARHEQQCMGQGTQIAPQTGDRVFTRLTWQW